ncbi:MAG: HdeD family acid-resistance protein [Alphaproteobacteria bacterium]|nr:MAG: HdeD family acid-resistance protein [Alphaproteobacteria bacterium]
MSATSTSPAPVGSPLVQALAQYWWLLLLRGIAAIIFGVLAFAWPGITLVTLVLFWGAFALVDGVLALANAFMGGNMGDRWWLALVGLAGIAAGILTFAYPGVTALVLLFFIATWAIVLGVLQIIGAIRLRKEIDNEWTIGLSGAVSVLFGVIMLVAPGAGAVGLIWAIASFAIVFGILMVMAAFKLKKHQPA